MTFAAGLQVVIFFGLLVVCVKPLGLYMNQVFAGANTFLSPVLTPVERVIYRLCRIRPDQEMRWTTYVFALLALSFVNAIALYAMLRLQALLPLNPQHFPGVQPDVAWNTAISFITTTDWQAYSGESTMSYLSQMTGLAWQNFMAAAIGLAACIALIRGLVRANAHALGNFWVDVTRALLYVLLPLSVIGALLFAWQGVPQNFHPYLDVRSLEGFVQSITGGPMASQEIIKLLGGNGGGFVAANSASPNENPTPIANLVQLLAMFIIPAALTYTFGLMVGDRRQGWAIFAAMSALFIAGVVGAQLAESAGNPLVHALGVSGGNMEGKEARFGVNGAGLSIGVATDSTVGAANVAYDSLTPLGGLVALANMQIGEVAYGGVGSGLMGMLAFVILTVFIAGLMVGRTPEYLGKKIEVREMKLIMLSVLAFPLAILIPGAIAAITPAGLATLSNGGPHGLSEILYAFTSSTGNNGSAFGGLGPSRFYDLATSVSMYAGRFLVMLPMLALAGSLAAKARNPAVTRGTFNTASAMFVSLVLAVVIIVGLLTFVPGDALGPIAEHLLMLAGKTFS
jgi:potassium-transporting ATPase potassium-binding subunit